MAFMALLLVSTPPPPGYARDSTQTLRIYDIDSYPWVDPETGATVSLQAGSVVSGDPSYVAAGVVWVELTDATGYATPVLDPIDYIGDGWYRSKGNFWNSSQKHTLIAVRPVNPITYNLQVRAYCGSPAPGGWSEWKMNNIAQGWNPINLIQNYYGNRSWPQLEFCSSLVPTTYPTITQGYDFLWTSANNSPSFQSGVYDMEFRGILPNTGRIQFDVTFSTQVMIQSVTITYKSGNAIDVTLENSTDQVTDSFGAQQNWSDGVVNVDGQLQGQSLTISLQSGTTLNVLAVEIEFYDYYVEFQPYVYPLSPDAVIDYAQYIISDDVVAAYANWFVQPYNAENYTMDPAPDLDPVPFEGSNEYQLTYFSAKPGAYVHSPTMGRVDSIEPLTAADCESVTFGATPVQLPSLAGLLEMSGQDVAGLIQELINSYLLGADKTAWCSIRGSPALPLDPVRIVADYVLPAADIVEIYDLSTGASLYYIVGAASEYVKVGQMVSPGCVLGLTLPLFETTRGASLWQIPYNHLGLGVGFIWADFDGVPFDVRFKYRAWPSADQPCNTPTFGECLNQNDKFLPQSPFWWTVSESPQVASDLGGLLMSPTTSASQLLAVGDDTELAVLVHAAVKTANSGGSDSVLNVTLGDTTHQVSISPGGALQQVIPLATYTDSVYGPGAINLTIAQASGQDGTVLVKRVCVSESVPELPGLPECVVDDAGFNAAAMWVLTGGATIGNGMLTLPVGATADDVFYGQPDIYDISIRYRHQPTTSPPSPMAVDLHWVVQDMSDTEIASGAFTASNGDWTDGSATFQLSSAQSVKIVLENGSSTGAVQVDIICLTPRTIPKDPGSPSQTNCNSCPATYIADIAHDTVESTEWLGCEIRRLYYCDMQGILTDTRDAADGTLRGIGMIGRWFSATAAKFVSGTTSLARYLAGYMHNVGLMIQDSIFYSGGASTYIQAGSNATIFDVLAALIGGLRDVLVTAMDSLVRVLGYLVPLAGTLRDVALAAFSSLQTVINALITQINHVTMIFAAILDAVNVDPATIPGAPNCSVDLESGNAHWICWAFYVMDNTIFAGAAGFMLPILVAAAALNLLLWAVEQFKNALAQTG